MMDVVRQQKQFKIIKRKDEAYDAICAREAHLQETAISAQRMEIDRLARIEAVRAQSMANAAAVFGAGYLGYGNGLTEYRPSRILYPKERKRPRRHLKEFVFSRETLRRVAEVEEVLVPVRLDIDYDKYKLRDTFTFNLNDTTIPIDLFAQHLCEDYHLPQAGFAAEIQKSLKAQLAEHHPHKFSEEQEGNTVEMTQLAPESYTDTRDDDLRIPIKLDITLGTFNLIDQFEWDINNSKNDAERFAAHFCSELGLATEFVTAIAHAIREQCQMYTKSLFLVGHPFDGRGVQDNDLRQMLMPSLFASLRPKHTMDKFAPALQELNADQLERIEREREREGRRNRRQTRGKRGANLPDLTDIPKTYRTPYACSVLVADENKWADKFAAVRAPVPGTTEFDDLSDIDERIEEKHRDRESGLTDRGIRSLRGHKAPVSNDPQQQTRSRTYVPPPHYISDRSPIILPPGYGPSALNHPTRERPSPFSRRPDTPPQTMSQIPQHHARSTPRAAKSLSPDPSLVLKFKIPALKQFLAHIQQSRHAPGISYQQQHHVPEAHSKSQVTEAAPSRQELIQQIDDQMRSLHKNFPYDHFEPIIKEGESADDIRFLIRCLSCPGKLYYHHDFDVHLRNRTHRYNVEQEMNAIDPNTMHNG